MRSTWFVVAAITIASIGLAGQWAAARERRFQSDAIRRTMDVHLLGLRDAAGKYASLPYTASLHPSILHVLARPGDPGVRRDANRYIQDVSRHAGSEVLYLSDLQGVTVAASNWDTPQSFVGRDYANRPYFVDALAGHKGFFYGVGQTTGEPGLFISTPVRDPGGEIRGVMTVKVSLGPLQDAWATARAPILLSDARGIVFLGTVASWMYASRRPLSEIDLQWMKRHRQYGKDARFPMLPWTFDRDDDATSHVVHANLDGKVRRFLVVDEPLPDLGWTLTVMADYSEVTQARERTWLLGILAAAVLLLGALYWQSRERRLEEQRTARRELEQRVRDRTHALDEAHAFRKAMEDSLPVGMRARDLEGRIIYVNAAFCDMTGYGTEELLGKLPPYPYWHPAEVDEYWRHHDAMMSGQSARSGFESRLLHRSGRELTTRVCTSRLIDAHGRHSGWMSSVVDITEQKHAERRQRQDTEQLQHAQRLASLGELASTLAHELNQPLMALSNFASAAKAFAEQGNRLLLFNSLDEIATQTHRSAEILNRIRGFVRQRTVGFESCSVAGLVTDAIGLLEGEMRQHRVRTEIRVSPALPAVRADRVLLEQVLLNLLSNSVQAVKSLPLPRKLIEVDADVLGPRMHLHVTDHGTGIDAALAEQVFTPFFTTRPDGLGLGLNICRTIMEAHRGRLTFTSLASGGTVFHLELELSV